MEEKHNYQQVLMCAQLWVPEYMYSKYSSIYALYVTLYVNPLYDKCSPAALISCPNIFSYVLQTDIRDYDAILAACEGADCVFHVASYGMSGLEQVSPHSFGFFCVTANTECEKLML